VCGLALTVGQTGLWPMTDCCPWRCDNDNGK